MDAKRFTSTTLIQVLLSCIFCFVTGSLYSLGIFSTFVEEAAIPPNSLDGSWASGMALISVFGTASMFYAGIYLSKDFGSVASQEAKILRSNRARLVATVGALSYALLALGGLGVASDNTLLIQAALSSVGIGFGLLYLLPMELLAAWVPHRPGLAVGIGQMTFGLGNIAASSVFAFVLKNYSVQNALFLAALMIALPTITASPFVQWPHTDFYDGDEKTESTALLGSPSSLSLKDLVKIPSFWLYFSTILSLQAGYGFIPYYFKIGHTFGKEVPTLVAPFQAATILATLSRPLIGALVDIAKTRQGFFSMGSKNGLLVLLAGQVLSFLALIPESRNGSYEGFTFFAGAILIIFAASSCCAPLLAREQFGAKNSSAVYGTAGSAAMGLGEVITVVLMGTFETRSAMIGTPSAYLGFYVLAFFWSGCGLVSCALLKPQDHEDYSPIEPMTISKTSHAEASEKQPDVP